MGGPAYFRSANDALNEVFSAAQTAIPTSPSPKKRTRAEMDLEDETITRDADDDIAMESDDEPVFIITGANHYRPIKPMRKPSPRRVPTPTTSPPRIEPSDSGVMLVDRISSVPKRDDEYANLFNQPF